MGSFQITHDDFTGGHYMGNKSAALPKNTWYGTNAILNPKGELIPGVAGQVHTFSPPASQASGKIWYGWTTGVGSYFVATYTNSGGTNTTRLHDIAISGGNVISTNTRTLTGQVLGKCTVTREGGTTQFLYYVDRTTGNVRRYNYLTSSDTLVSNVLAGQSVDSIVNYKFRLLVWGSDSTNPGRLFYSNNTKNGFDLTDYYDFDGPIANVIPRSNDVLVITSEGVFSATGVFGSSLNIQLVAPPNELLPGMVEAKASGRAIYFAGEASPPYFHDGRIYELLGATTTEVVRLGLEDLNSSFPDKIDLNVIEGGNVAIMISNGAIYVRKSDLTFARLISTAVNPALGYRNQSYICNPLLSAVGEQYDTVAATMTSGLNVEVHVIGHARNYPAALLGTTTPASATVQLSEYWHQRPMVVREVLVETVYDDYQDKPFELTGNATVALKIKPVGAVDYTVLQTPLLESSTQTYTTAITNSIANGSRVLHRFRTDDAVRGYGFYPEITWQGCRIRRVIAVCED